MKYFQVRIVSLLIFLIVTSIVHVVSTCSDPISCKLQNINIKVPPLSIPIGDGTFIYIDNFECNQLSLDSIPSAYIAPTSFEFGLNNGNIFCHGHYTYLKLKGIVNATIGQLNVNMTIDITEENKLPVALSVHNCYVPSLAIDIVFAGNIGANILNLLIAVFKTAIEIFFQDFFCIELTSLIAVNGTKWLDNTVDPALMMIINQQPAPVPKFDIDLVHWKSLLSPPSMSHTSCLDRELPGMIDKLQRPVLDTVMDLLTDGTGEIIIPIEKLIRLNGTQEVTIHSITLGGLDTFSNISLYEPSTTSNITIVSELALDSLFLSVNLTVHGASSPYYDYEEWLIIEASVSKTSLHVETVVALGKAELSQLYLNQILQPACLLKSLKFLNITSLVLETNVDTLAINQIQGAAQQLEKDSIALIDNALKLLAEGFGPLLTDLIKGFGQGILRPLLNNKIENSLVTLEATTPCMHKTKPYDDYIVWADSKLIKAVDRVVNDLLGARGLNAILKCVTKGTGSVSISASEFVTIDIGGLDSFKYINILEPFSQKAVTPKPYDMGTEIDMGLCNGFTCRPLTLAVTVDKLMFNRTSSGGAIGMPLALPSGTNSSFGRNTIQLSMALDNLYLYIDTLIQVSVGALLDLTVQDMSVGGCGAAVIRLFEISNLNLLASEASVTINGERENDVTRLVNKLFSVLGKDKTLSSMNQKIATKIESNNQTCRGYGGGTNSTSDSSSAGITDSSGSSSISTGTWLNPLIVCLSLLLGATVIAYLINPKAFQLTHEVTDEKEVGNGSVVVKERRYNSSVATRNRSIAGYHKRHAWDWKGALAFNDHLYLWLRAVLVTGCLADIALFMYSNQTPEAVAVMLTLTLGPKTVKLDIFSLGLVVTIDDMWDASAYGLAVLISFSSVAWPYVKLACLLVCLLAPPNILPVASRDTLLKVMDALGKWCLVDCFFMIIFGAAFYIQLSVGEKILVGITVEEHWGFYSYILAAIISLVLGHAVIACHRRVVNMEMREQLYGGVNLDKLDIPSNSNVESVAGHTFTVMTKSLPVTLRPAGYDENNVLWVENKTDVKMTILGGLFVFLYLIATCICVFCGISFMTVAFNFEGLVGYLLTTASYVEYSFISLGLGFPESTGYPDSFATRWLQVCFFLFGLGMPAAVLISSMILWFVPMSRSTQMKMLVITEIFNAWTALDVFCVSIITGLLELPLFTTFIVGDNCDGINQILAKYFDTMLDGEDYCFAVQTIILTVSDYFFILFFILL